MLSKQQLSELVRRVCKQPSHRIVPTFSVSTSAYIFRQHMLVVRAGPRACESTTSQSEVLMSC